MTVSSELNTSLPPLALWLVLLLLLLLSKSLIRIVLIFSCYDEWVGGWVGGGIFFNMVEVGKESRRSCLSQVKPFILFFNHHQQ